MTEKCCEGLKGWQLAWHKYAVHGGPYPKKSHKARAVTAKETPHEAP